MIEPTFPPLFSAQRVGDNFDPFARACEQAEIGADAGTVVYAPPGNQLRAAMIFAPDIPLREAVAVRIACGLGFQNAFGALAPPKAAVHLGWDGGIDLNGASCGRFRFAANTQDPQEIPGWLVVGLEVQLLPRSDLDPGLTPNDTSFFDEGCIEVEPILLLEAWTRHTLHWINRMTDEGNKPLHAEWEGLSRATGEALTVRAGNKRLHGEFVGVDEHFGMLMRRDGDVRLVGLHEILEQGVA